MTDWGNQSCWLIEFEDGYRIIISEERYKKEEEHNWAGKKILCKQHWFNARKCIERNRGVRAVSL